MRLRNSTNVILIIIAVILVCIMACYGPPARAEPFEYDPIAGAQIQTIRSLIVKTRMCMATAAQIAMRGGARDTDDVSAFLRRMCGAPIYTYLVGAPHWVPEDAADLVLALSIQETRFAVAKAGAYR